MKRPLYLAALCAAALSLSACGFQPLYATTEAGEAGGLAGMKLVSLSTSEDVGAYVQREFDRRTRLKGPARYELYLQADERAERLNVQIDGSVTRFNYRLVGQYELVDLESGERLKGTEEAIVSFNVANSQYSTLAAERTAREKAAALLAELIERDILLQQADARKK